MSYSFRADVVRAGQQTNEQMGILVHFAKDIMTRDVIVVSPEASVNETIGKLLEHHISGAPVVDGLHHLVGIISEFRLLQAIYDPLLKFSRVGDLMTPDVLTVGEFTPISVVVSLMIWNRVRRVPVLSDDRLVGLVSRPDLIRYALETPLAEQLQCCPSAEHELGRWDLSASQAVSSGMIPGRV